MDDRLQALEERLGELVPRGLSDNGRARLDAQIDALAAVAEASASRPRWRWKAGLGIAAAVVALAGVAIVASPGSSDSGPELVAPDAAGAAPAVAETPEVSLPTDFESVEFERTVGDGQYRGIVLVRVNEPMHSWNHLVREMELLLHTEDGLKLQVVEERQEEIRVAVTSF